MENEAQMGPLTEEKDDPASKGTKKARKKRTNEAVLNSSCMGEKTGPTTEG